MIGQTILHYKILEKLGEGGMGVVYKAHDTKLDRIVALKFLPLHLTANDAEKARFMQEARAAATLNHPHVCTIYRIDEYEGQQFIEMECIDGETLRRKIPVQKTDDAVNYAIQIGEALQEAHAKGIVHRDIKADNIMVNAKNQIKVMDFGLAKLKGSLKLTKTSSTVGTLAYMAPEQIQGGEVDVRSDIFSFGIVLFEMLAGKTPFHGEHEAAVMYSIVNEEPDSILKFKPDISPEIDRIIQRSLEKDPEDRYQHVDDMVSELRRSQKKSTRVVRPSAAGVSAIHTSSVENKTAPIPASLSKKKFIIPGIAAVILIAAAVWFYFFSGHQQVVDSLAVLPFENVGGSQDLDYLSDGVTESLINNLTKIQGLRVVPRTSAFRFKGKNVDIYEAGSKLNVRAILTGKIVSRGSALDVQVDLIDIKNESQLWGNHYQSDLNNLLTLQDQITTEVSSKLGIGVSSETQQNLTKRATDNTQAYQLYLQGRYYWNKRNAVAIENAINYFKQAIALDSNYALAYAGMADCYMIQSQYSGIPTKITVPLAREYAQHALQINNSLAEAHTTLAFSYFSDWKYNDAEREFKQAIALNPRYPTVYHWYNILLARMGRIDEASAVIKQAYDLDSFSPVITLNVGAIELFKKNYEGALPYFQKSIQLEPSFAPGYEFSGIASMGLKRDQDALAQFQKSVELSGRSSEALSYLGYFYGKTGKREEALKLLDENEKRYRDGTGSAYNIAAIYEGLGEKDKTLEWLERDVQDQSTWTTDLLTDRRWDDIRTDPRFVVLLKKVGLVK